MIVQVKSSDAVRYLIDVEILNDALYEKYAQCQTVLLAVEDGQTLQSLLAPGTDLNEQAVVELDVTTKSMRQLMIQGFWL